MIKNLKVKGNYQESLSYYLIKLIKLHFRWKPIYGAEQVIVSVISMLNDPNTDSPANIDASVQFKNDPAGYKKKVLQCVAKSLD